MQINLPHILLTQYLYIALLIEVLECLYFPPEEIAANADFASACHCYCSPSTFLPFPFPPLSKPIVGLLSHFLDRAINRLM